MILKLTLIFSILAVLSSICMITVRNPVHAILCLILVFCNISFILLIWGAEFIAIIFLVVYVGAIAVLFLFVVMMLNIKIVELNETFWKYLPIGLIIALIFFIEIYIAVFHGGLLTSFKNLIWLSADRTLLFGKVLFLEHNPSEFSIIAEHINFTNICDYNTSNIFHFYPYLHVPYTLEASYYSNFNINNNSFGELFNVVMLKQGLIDFNVYSNWEHKSNTEVLGWFIYTYSFPLLFILGILLLIAMVGSIILILNQNINTKRQAIFNQISREVKSSIVLKN